MRIPIFVAAGIVSGAACIAMPAILGPSNLPASVASAATPRDGSTPPGTLQVPGPFPTVQPIYATYVVRPGDTIERVAARFHDTVYLIVRRNGLPAWPAMPSLRPGQRLRVLSWPFDTCQPIPGTVALRIDTSKHYTVQAGDGLWRIAQMFHVPMGTLVVANSLKAGGLIYPGQTLTIPSHRTVMQHVLIGGVDAASVPTNILLDVMASIVGEPAPLLKAMTWTESRWSNAKRGLAGEYGMVQIMPALVRSVEKHYLGYRLDPRDLAGNLVLGALLLRTSYDLQGHDLAKTFAYYHSGTIALGHGTNREYVRNAERAYRYFVAHPAAGYADAAASLPGGSASNT
jgi:LysM repeat protein